MEIRCQGGLYVKELVSGDEGRTIPERFGSAWKQSEDA